MLLYHYFDKKTGPFWNLSDLSEEEAKKLFLTIKAEKPETMCAKRQDSYIADRRRFEDCDHIVIDTADLELSTVSFTYGDSHPTFSDRGGDEEMWTEI